MATMDELNRRWRRNRWMEAYWVPFSMFVLAPSIAALVILAERAITGTWFF